MFKVSCIFPHLDNCYSVWHIFFVNQLAARKVKKKVLRFKKKILNYFLHDRVYPDIDLYGRKNNRKNKYITYIIARVGS